MTFNKEINQYVLIINQFNISITIIAAASDYIFILASPK